ncbi:MAG TPA: lamin tail domain-containing protein, partial [Clostridia bacterium]|nr:lamin tail domain-containing protein [Clostridia bacterium]
YIPAAGVWTFGVNSDDGFSLTVGPFTVAHPTPRGSADSVQAMSFPAAGNYPIRLVYFERAGAGQVELYAAQGSFAAFNAAAFRLVGDTVNGGLQVTAEPVSGSGGLSYLGLIGTNLVNQMSGRNPSAYLRVPFNLANAAGLQSLTLRMQYDDGFALWLNGQRVASRNAPVSPVWNSTATGSHPNALALRFEEINLSDQLHTLQNGLNYVAIQGLNIAANDPDFLIVPELVEYRLTNGPLRFFTGFTPGYINAGGAAAFVADTKFSVDRGFFEAPFSLVISSDTPGATIIYTTNGTIPALDNGTVYTGPMLISGTTVLRAAAFRDGYLPSDVDTQTYLFLSDVIRQSPNGAPPAGWPASWGANATDYGMDPDIVNHPGYGPGLIEDLKSIPTFSLVTTLSNLFDPATGIYANPSQDGREWERPASLELIDPAGNTFQVNCGLRIRGGFSRSLANPKHSFRLLFRSDYGDAKLNYPVFAKQGGAEEFDGFDLRTAQNYSWSYLADYRFIGLRDQFSRDTQVAMGQSAERGDFYHLYINGQYWGLYNSAERAEASYSESYFGGSKEDYDVVKVDGGNASTTDGNLDAWGRLWQAATNGFLSDVSYFKVQGLNLDGTPNPAYENLVEIDNLIDYMLLIFFSGNIDAPITQFGGNNGPNNFYAARNRTGLFGGFRFFAHDSEHTLLFESSLGSDNQNELYRDRTGPFAAGDPVQQGAATAFLKSNPGYLFSRLSQNAEFRLRVADRVQKYFLNGGLFTTENLRSRFQVRSNEIYRAVVAESARWGDSKRATPFTRDLEWRTEVNRVYGTYFAQRPGIVLGQLQAKSLYPPLAAPVFNQFGGVVSNGFQVIMSAAGTIYYTRDGSDPRLRGGAVSQQATAYAGPVGLNQSTTFKARVLNGGIWSALTECTFYIQRDFTELSITEIMYHPPDTLTQDGDAFEFIELKNVSSASLDLSGVRFTNGISFEFPVGTILGAGEFIVLAGDPAGFTNKYPAVPISGVYQGRLSNSGERLTLVHVTGVPIASFEYGTRAPWPVIADGGGFSLVPVDPNLNLDPASVLNWRTSTDVGGSPGADDPPSNIPRVVINELLTHTDPPQLDTIELYNPYPTNVNLAGWFLTDARTAPAKYRVPAGREIPAFGYLLFTENDWNADPQSTNSFRLDSLGESVYLFSADTNGTLTGYSEGVAFGAARNGVSFGRYTNSVGDVHFPAQITTTLPGANSGPRIGPVVINEIHYHPAPGGDAFVEIKNITGQTVRLYDPLFPTNTWRLNGAGFQFPNNSQLAPDGLALIVGIDPAVFRSKYGVPAAVPIFTYTGSLQGGGESLALQMPDQPDVQGGTVFVPYIDVDVVRYDNRTPWPTAPDGTGPSLERLEESAYGNDPINWRSSPGIPSPGWKNTGNRPPLVNAGPDQTFDAGNAPFAVALAGSAADDGGPNPLQVSWTFLSGPRPAWFENATQPATTAYFPGVGVYTLRLTADDGQVQTSDEVTFTIQHPRSALALVPAGSIWKYLDDGSDQGAAWRARLFNDQLWPSGPAPLGYEDANGQWPATTNSYGANASFKHLTYYYRHAFNVANPASMTNLVLQVQRDDGVIVYLNGVGIFTNNLPLNVPITYLTNASGVVGGANELAFLSQEVNPALLLAGTNVLAAELHQSSRTSSDIWFECTLSGDGYPANQAPAVQAGPDQTIHL